MAQPMSASAAQFSARGRSVKAVCDQIEAHYRKALNPSPTLPLSGGGRSWLSRPLPSRLRRSEASASPRRVQRGGGHIGTRIFGGRGSATRSNAMCVSMRSQNAIAPIIKAFIAKKVTPGRCGPTGRLCARRIWHREGYSDAGAVRSRPASGGAMLARTHEEPLILPT